MASFNFDLDSRFIMKNGIHCNFIPFQRNKLMMLMIVSFLFMIPQLLVAFHPINQYHSGHLLLLQNNRDSNTLYQSIRQQQYEVAISQSKLFSSMDGSFGSVSNPSTKINTTTNKTTIDVTNKNNNIDENKRRNIRKEIQEIKERWKYNDSKLQQENFDNLLAQCIAYDESDALLTVLSIMQDNGFQKIHSTYKTCLKACYDVSNAVGVEDILSVMEQEQFQPDSSDIGLAILTMCRKEQTEKGWWVNAAHLVKQYDDLSVPVYDAVLSCLSNEKQWQEAIRLLRSMEEPVQVGYDPQSKTLPDISTYRIVIECCIRSDQAEQGVQVLQSCVRRGLKPTTYTFELVIAALSKKLQWRRAMQLVDLMDQLNIAKSLQIYNSVITSCSKARESVPAKNLLMQMRKSNIKPNIVSYNSVISACASTSEWKDALAMLDLAQREPGVTPDIYTFTNAIRACAKGGQTQRALTLFQVAKDKRLPLDSYFYTAVMEACSKVGMWQKALELLDEMEKGGIKPSEVTYSVAISACGNGGQWKKALDLLSIMRQRKMPINLYVYNAAITAISKAAKRKTKITYDNERQMYNEIMTLIDEMKKDNIQPDGFTFSSAISCCGSEGRWQEALELIELMRKGGPQTQPNKIAYTAAISSCGRSGQAEYAITLFRQMKDQGLQPDLVAYNALFSALRVAKKSEEAFELWDEMLGTKKSNTVSAGNYQSTTPDIITVTDAIAAMSSISDSKNVRDKVDKVFAQAFKLNILFRNTNSIESGEVDLSGLSFPVARAACRYMLNRYLSQPSKFNQNTELFFITGIGASHDDGSSSLRDFVQEILLTDFIPPIESIIPEQERSKVHVKATTLASWSSQQSR